MFLPIASYHQPGRNTGRLVNCYPQASLSTKGPVELLSVPGIVSHATLSGPGRGLFVQKDSLYAVGGLDMYSVDSLGTATSLGTVPGTDLLTMAGNGIEIVLSNGYYYDGSTVAPVPDGDMPGVEAVDFVDGYILGVESNSGRFVGSDLNDATSWDALSYATAEGSPDNLLTLKVDHRQVLLFGTDSIEIWWNSGISGFPFERLSGGFVEIGCLAKHSVVKADNSVFWLASDRTIRRLSNQTPQRVSQHGVEEKIASYASVSDCIAFSWTWDGHIFIAFRFPSQEACWVFDVTSNEWHERSTYGSSDWLISGVASCHGRVYVQDALTGNVGYLSDESYTEFGGILRREWTYPLVYNGHQRTFFSEIEVVCQTGNAPIGITPYINLDISDDGGNTWRTMPQKELGTSGDYTKRVRWQRLGSGRNRVFRCYVSDAVPVKVQATELIGG